MQVCALSRADWSFFQRGVAPSTAKPHHLPLPRTRLVRPASFPFPFPAARENSRPPPFSPDDSSNCLSRVLTSPLEHQGIFSASPSTHRCFTGLRGTWLADVPAALHPGKNFLWVSPPVDRMGCRGPMQCLGPFVSPQSLAPAQRPFPRLASSLNFFFALALGLATKLQPHPVFVVAHHHPPDTVRGRGSPAQLPDVFSGPS